MGALPRSLARQRLHEVEATIKKLSFAVGDPDVFDLGGVLEEEAAFGLGGVEPVDGAAFVGENLF